MAQVCVVPALTARTSAYVTCPTGPRSKPAMIASPPSWPEPFSPQHATSPESRREQEYAEPVEIDVIVPVPPTITGTRLAVIVPFPSSPDALLPKHVTWPVSRSTQVLDAPPSNG